MFTKTVTQFKSISYHFIQLWFLQKLGAASVLNLTTLMSNSADDLFKYFTENRIWQFMQIVSNGDNLHEMSKPVLWEKQEKYFKRSSAENFTQSDDCFL